MSIEVHAPQDRFLTRAQGRTTWHSFSFGAHYDPHNTGFGALIALNDELLPPGTGYPEHAHTDTEIITWMVTGALEHTDSTGGSAVLGAGQVQRLSAGSGIRHSEVNGADGPARFVQSWLRPDDLGLVPSHEVATVEPVLDGWVCLAGEGGVGVGVRGAALWLVELSGSGSAVLPDAPRLHLMVTTGCVLLGDAELPAGATARLVGRGGRVDATAPGTQVLAWALP